MASADAVAGSGATLSKASAAGGAELPTAEVARMPPYVDVAGEKRAFARLYGFVAASWRGSGPPEASDAAKRVDTFVARLPFALGRTPLSDAEVSDSPEQWLVVDSNTVSRKHATIFYDADCREFRLRCHSRNGLDVNQAHVGMNEVVSLPSRSALRVGPLYAFFLLPKEVAPSKPAPRQHARPTIAYKDVIAGVSGRHFANLSQGYFTLPALMALGSADYPGRGLPEDPESFRGALKRVLDKEDSGYEQVDPAAVPPAVVESLSRFHQRKQRLWYRPKVGGSGAAGGGGGGGAGDAGE